MIKRILIVASCVAFLVCATVIPASAANQVIDYDDIVANVSTSDGYDTVFLRWPFVGYFASTVYPANQGELNLTLSYSPADFYYFPFRNGDDTIRLSKTDIPDDAVFTIYFSCESINVPTGFWIYLQQFDKDGNMISSVHQTVDYLYSEESKIVQLWNAKPLDFVDGCDSFAIVYNWRANGVPITVNGTTSYSYNFTNPIFDISFKLSSAYRQQQQTNKTNNLLKAVEKQIAENGQTLEEVLQQQQQTNDQLGDLNDKQDETNDKLDGIINDKVDPSLPSGGDVVGDLDDAEGQIRDDAQSGLDQGAQVQQSAIQVMGQYLSAFACVSWIFDRFSTIPFVSGLLALSFSLGITGAILGIGLSVFNSYSAAERKRSARAARSSRSSRSKGG